METFIIELKTKVDGEWRGGLFHEKLTESTRKDTTNAYMEHITSDQNKAKRFYDKDEATRFAVLFSNNFQFAKIVPVKD